MPDCELCGHETIRTRRTPLQKVFNEAAFQCPKCGDSLFFKRRLFQRFSFCSQCPQCGTRHLSKLRSVDRVDRLNKNPLRLLLGILHAPLYHCTFCRLQFWDLRKRQARSQPVRAKVASAGSSTLGI